MAIMKKKEMRESSDTTLQEKLTTYVRELNFEKGVVKNGGRTSNPGKIKELRHTVARILTILHERKESKTVGTKLPPVAAKPAAKKDAKKEKVEVKNVA
ncbi:50S ribosomal protein L29 [Candidatus Anstonella stagnisolia]|nr:50S ribosomal protein L29 [Candidatus Anstonella stagnisolia]